MRPGRAPPGCVKTIERSCCGMFGFNEAGARAPRMLNTYVHTVATDFASMRPGRAPPGCSVWSYVNGSTTLASMRPGRAPPGCRQNGHVGRRASSRFNEAGARAPRMRVTRELKFIEILCFNEAGARAPRMLCKTIPTPLLNKSASMRPGRAPPGCHVPESEYSVVNTASMRPGRAPPGCHHASMRRGAPPGCPWSLPLRAPRMLSRNSGFNEAGARAPRIARNYALQ